MITSAGPAVKVIGVAQVVLMILMLWTSSACAEAFLEVYAGLLVSPPHDEARSTRALLLVVMKNRDREGEV